MAEEKDFSNACIYTIETKDGLYVGSTSNFKDRKTKHKTCIINKNSRDYNYKVYKNIRKNGEWKMSILKHFPCDNRTQLEAEEQLCIDELDPNLNSKRSIGLDSQEYYEINKEKIKECQKEYYEKNIEKINSKQKEKITCECGEVISRRNILRHKKTAKHLDIL